MAQGKGGRWFLPEAPDVIGMLQKQAAITARGMDAFAAWAGGDASRADEVRAAYSRMFANVAAYNASILLDGVLVEKMGRMGTEMIVGAKCDPEWGPVVLAGFGGVTAEILKDVKLFTPDMGRDAVIAGLLSLKQAPILAGWRGAPAAGRGRRSRSWSRSWRPCPVRTVLVSCGLAGE